MTMFTPDEAPRRRPKQLLPDELLYQEPIASKPIGFDLQAFYDREARLFMQDLDRCQHGRHEGDPCFDCAGRVSRGNPFITRGAPIGFSINGVPYVQPERGLRHDRRAWLGEKTPIISGAVTSRSAEILEGLPTWAVAACIIGAFLVLAAVVALGTVFA